MHLKQRAGGLTEVEIKACWREALRHEKAHCVLNVDFDFNPKNLISVTGKPNTVRSNFLMIFCHNLEDLFLRRKGCQKIS